MKIVLLTNWHYILGLLVGVVTGLVYWKYVGCLTGICSITTNPIRSMAYFGLMGALLFGMFERDEKKNNNNKDQQPITNSFESDKR